MLKSKTTIHQTCFLSIVPLLTALPSNLYTMHGQMAQVIPWAKQDDDDDDDGMKAGKVESIQNRKANKYFSLRKTGSIFLRRKSVRKFYVCNTSTRFVAMGINLLTWVVLVPARSIVMHKQQLATSILFFWVCLERKKNLLYISIKFSVPFRIQ